MEAIVFIILQAPVVQRLDNAIHWINHYPADGIVCFVNTYPLDSNLSGGWCYPAFEQPGPDLSRSVCSFEIGEYSRIFHSFSWGIFSHVMHLDQSHASENIWCIVIQKLTCHVQFCSGILYFLRWLPTVSTPKERYRWKTKNELFKWPLGLSSQKNISSHLDS